MINPARSGFPLRRLACVAAVCIAVFAAVALAGELETALAEEPAMHSFVIVFRRGADALADGDTRRLTEETILWAREQNDEGRELEPRALGSASAHRGAEQAAERDARRVTALLFLKAADLTDATAVAESHPALRYGFDVEVRPWAPPGP